MVNHLVTRVRALLQGREENAGGAPSGDQSLDWTDEVTHSAVFNPDGTRVKSLSSALDPFAGPLAQGGETDPEWQELLIWAGVAHGPELPPSLTGIEPEDEEDWAALIARAKMGNVALHTPVVQAEAALAPEIEAALPLEMAPTVLTPEIQPPPFALVPPPLPTEAIVTEARVAPPPAGEMVVAPSEPVAVATPMAAAATDDETADELDWAKRIAAAKAAAAFAESVTEAPKLWIPPTEVVPTVVAQVTANDGVPMRSDRRSARRTPFAFLADRPTPADPLSVSSAEAQAEEAEWRAALERVKARVG